VVTVSLASSEWKAELVRVVMTEMKVKPVKAATMVRMVWTANLASSERKAELVRVVMTEMKVKPVKAATMVRMALVALVAMVMAVWTASLVWMVNLADSAEVKEVDDLVMLLVPKVDNLARALLAVA